MPPLVSLFDASLKALSTFGFYLFFCDFAWASPYPELRVSKPVSAQLAKGATDLYQITLAENTFIYAELNQIDFDGKATVYDPTGAVVGVFDYMARGDDAIEFDTDIAGAYRFEVEGYRGDHGYYELEVEVVEPVANSPEKRLTQLLTSFSGNDTPGAIIAIVQDGKVVHHLATGMASLVYQVPFSRETPSNIGSVSKQFTAFAVVKLAQDGLINLEDDIRQYFPNIPDLGYVVTIRHLLNHTNGFREYLNMLYMSGRRIGEGDFIAREEIMHILENQPALQDEPGTRYNYNNTAYSLSAMLVEKVTKEPFETWLDKQVFQPLEMKHTRVSAHTGQIIPNAAQGYLASKDAPYRTSVDIGGGGGSSIGPGGIYSTVDDLARWLGNMSTGTVGGKAVFAEMMTPNIPEPGNNIFYGLGLGISNHKGLKLISHQGADLAHRANLWYLPELNAGIIGLSNNGRFDPFILKDVADVFFAEHIVQPTSEENENSKQSDTNTINISAAELVKLEGQYELIGYPNVMIFVWNEDGKLYTKRQGGDPQVLTPISNTRFRLSATSDYQFTLADDNQATLTLLDGSSIKAKRLEQWQPQTEKLPQFVADYYSEELGTVYRIVLEKDALVIKHPRIADMMLTPKVTDTFNAQDAISEVRFVRDDNGNITGFMASDVRTLNVWFKRQE